MGVFDLFVVALLLINGASVRCQQSGPCHRGPVGSQIMKTSGDGGFKIKISGNPQNYVPGEVYTVSIQGKRSKHTVQKYSGFMLAVQAQSPSSGIYGPQSVGTFQLYGDVLTMHSERCANAVIQTSHILKIEIQVLWTAPPAGSGCLTFMATVEEQRELWYMDDGQLTKELCEEVQESDDYQPEVIYDCCACNEAKYEVTFEGLWSRQTHPKDFPANEWLTHFSDIIGASHSNDYRVWEYGGFASDGLRQVAEWGSTRTLESELKRQSDHIRTIIKARGLWYPNVNAKTFAVFRVDNRHHLMSLVSMLGPSPDWIVGVSALELCLRNCSWVESKTLNLYPWDAGTDSGVTYMSSNKPSIPRQKIRRISNSSPNLPKSPFYDPKGLPMKPLARLTISRQRVYEKSCLDTGLLGKNEHALEYSEDDDAERPECAVSEWTEMSACSVTCGKGLRMRTRHYMIPMKADMLRCMRQLEEKEMCAASVPYCEGGNMHNIFGGQQYKFIQQDEVCRTSEWSSWMPCSVTCGKGFRVRNRRYVNRMGRKKCANEMTEKQMCVADVMQCGESDVEEFAPGCEVTQWSNWSPCSVTCGKGLRVKTRYFLVQAATQNSCKVKTMETTMCEGERTDCTIDKSEARVVCLQERKLGPCRGYFSRWYYDSTRGMCLQFIYGGCRGNRNNFESYDECIKMCEYARDELLPGGNKEDKSSSVTSSIYNPYGPNHNQKKSYQSPQRFNQSNGSNRYDNGGLKSENLLGPPKVNCMASKWGLWSSCSVTCGRGWTKQERIIKVHPQNGGRDCPRKLVRRHRCIEDKCHRCDDHTRAGENCHNLESLSFIFNPSNDTSSTHYEEDSEQISPLGNDPHHSLTDKFTENIETNGENTYGDDCQMKKWGEWSPCTQTCGAEALQQRSRKIENGSRNGGIPCGPRLERRYCDLPSCPKKIIPNKRRPLSAWVY